MLNRFLKKTGLGLAKTRRYLTTGLESLFLRKSKIDQETFEHLEALLIGADLGVKITERLIHDLKESVERKEVSDLGALKKKLQVSLSTILKKVPPYELSSASPTVTLFVGVNGVGKTTTIGKRAPAIV